MDTVRDKGGVVCAAVDPNLVDSDACAFATWAMPVVEAKAHLSGNNVYMGPGVQVDYSSGLRTLTLQGGEDAEEGVPLDLTSEVRNGCLCRCQVGFFTSRSEGEG